MELVDCIIRLSPKSEPYLTRLNLATGKTIENIPVLRALTTDELFGYKDNTSAKTITIDAFFDVMFKFKDVLMVISYYSNGFIVINNENKIWRCDLDLSVEEISKLDAPLVTVPIIETGCVLSPVLTFDVMQPAFKIGYFCFNNKVYSLTRFGFKLLQRHSDILDSDIGAKVTPSMLLDNDADNNYAGYFVNNELKYIKIGGGDL